MLENYSNVVNESEWQKLNFEDKTHLVELLNSSILKDRWLHSELTEDEVKDLDEVSMTLEEAIEDVKSGCITCYDGYGDWHFIKKSNGKHYKGVKDFSVDMLDIDMSDFTSLDDNTKVRVSSYIADFWRQTLQYEDFELVGILWYNK